MATDYDAPRVREGETDDADSLEELRAASAKRQAPQMETDDSTESGDFELPGADLSNESLDVTVLPAQDGEFTCTSCFLVHHRAAMASDDPPVCTDCAA